MNHPIAEEESYANRRQLFKNIWETAVHIKKEEERNARYVGNTSKVIKTARIADDTNRDKADKNKKQRLRNLRMVCNKLLRFCERHDEVFYSDQASKQWENSVRSKGRKPRKSKISAISKANRAKWRSMFIVEDDSQTGITSPDSQCDNKSSRSSSRNRHKETTLSVPEHFIKRQRSRRPKLPDPKTYKREDDKYPNKRLFPINKILIH